jgi:hypothetical protein
LLRKQQPGAYNLLCEMAANIIEKQKTTEKSAQKTGNST